MRQPGGRRCPTTQILRHLAMPTTGSLSQPKGRSAKGNVRYVKSPRISQTRCSRSHAASTWLKKLEESKPDMPIHSKMFPAKSIGEVSLPTPYQGRGHSSYQPRIPTVITLDIYVQPRPSKKHGRMAFSVKPPTYRCVKIDAIGTMTTKYFLVDNLSLSTQDGMTVTFPPLTPGEAKDMVRTIQEILDIQISPKKCKPIGADILDVETLVIEL